MMMVKLLQLFVGLIAFQNIHCTEVKLTCEHIKTFVDMHNKFRLEVAAGEVPDQPSASDMQRMLWDDDLAAKAAKWAEGGEFTHNPDISIKSELFNSTGENLYVGFASGGKVIPIITDAIQLWFTEHKYYVYQPITIDVLSKVGHYTQMVWAKTNRVGCAIDQRKEHGLVKTLIVCNYGPPGNIFYTNPYTKSEGKGNLVCNGDCSKAYGNKC
nr:venom protein U-MPTX.10-24 [Megalopyge opercularis]